ncbi:MAG: PIN domain-containing protein [Spirochaetaceae bacterium]|nr:PIN domain-containing protein [Spirochaetaceae bacterium]
MILWDVNLWVYAFRSDSPFHTQTHETIAASLERRDPFLFYPQVASSFLRLVTNPRVFVQPSPMAEAWAFIDYLESHPAAAFAEADAMTFGIFKHLCLISGATANTVPDAFLAALAIRRDAKLLTMDAGMRRFAGLDVEVLGT